MDLLNSAILSLCTHIWVTKQGSKPFSWPMELREK